MGLVSVKGIIYFSKFINTCRGFSSSFSTASSLRPRSGGLRRSIFFRNARTLLGQWFSAVNVIGSALFQ